MSEYRQMEISIAIENLERMKKNGTDKIGRSVMGVCELLISDEQYGKFLSSDLKIEANKLIWGIELTADEYKEFFLASVLMRAYRPFDESHKNYFALVKAIRKFNPEWEEAFVRRHNEWVKMLQDRKVPIYIGTQ